MMALRDHYNGDATTNKKLTRYQGIISNIEYINKRTATWENQLTKLIEAYQWMHTRANQSYTDDIKVVKFCTMIRVANNNALAIAVEYMRNNFRVDFDGAVTYITGRINEINTHKPSAATRQVSQTRKTSWNRVDITNPERDFQPNKWEQLKPDDQKRSINIETKTARNVIGTVAEDVGTIADVGMNIPEVDMATEAEAVAAEAVVKVEVVVGIVRTMTPTIVKHRR